MASTVYRRHSMAQLYEKLRAQDDADDMAWLAQFSPEDKFDEPYVPPAPLSTISSASPSASYISTRSPHLDCEISDDHFDSDSDSDVDPEPLSLPYPEFDSSVHPPLIFQPHDFTPVTGPTDSPYVPLVQDNCPLQSRSTPPSAGSGSLPLLVPVSPTQQAVLPAGTFAPSTTRRATRYTRDSSAGHRSPVVFHDSKEDVCSESEGNGSEDEYLPSPTVGCRRRRRAARSASAVGASSRKRGVEKTPHKQRRHSPHPRNVQADPGLIPPSPAAKNNPWACPYCKWVQRNHRTPDLKRHIRTHTRLQRPAQWVCCGVRLEDAKNYHLPADAQPYAWEGEMMVGGCCKEFSRRDALKRHLDNDHISCIGNFAAFASVCDDVD